MTITHDAFDVSCEISQDVLNDTKISEISLKTLYGVIKSKSFKCSVINEFSCNFSMK